MKHLSLLLTVLMLGAMPLTAAALDYGPNRPLLAVDNSVPQLPGTQAHTAQIGTMPKPDVAEAGDDDTSDALPAAPHTAPPPSPPIAGQPSHGPSASNKPRNSTTKPTTAPSPASWQSLLPGSIQ